MELPNQYPYNPRVRLILCVFGAGLLWIAVQWLSRGHLPTGFSLWFSLAPIAVALINAVRRMSVERYLLLDNESMVLPIGLFHMGTARIEYSGIVRVWRHYLPATVVLRVATQNCTFDVVSKQLPNNASYRAIEGFLTLMAQENTARKRQIRGGCAIQALTELNGAGRRSSGECRLSAEAREKIRQAQIKRWRKVRAAKKR